MSELSNVFSVLNLDAEDDKEQTSCLTTVSAIDECSSRISFLNLDAEDDKEQTRCLTTVSAIDECSSRISGDGDNQDFEVTMKRAHSDSYKSHNNIHPSWLPSVSGSYKLPLVWIDLEMTGLEIEVDRILEIACIITDGKLIKSVEGPDLVIKQSKECLDNMGEWCREHHSASGLTERVLQSTITEKDAEEQVINFVRNHVGAQAPLLAGNSVYVDFMFLKKYMPCLASIFPHVLVDVSSITALCMRWFPKEKKAAPTKEKKHRAMDDIKESIRELKYYKESIFKGFRKSK